jgi:PiT family inorganic phosphate transporter
MVFNTNLTYNAESLSAAVGHGYEWRWWDVDKLIVLIPLVLLCSIQGILTGLFGAPSIVSTMIASRAMGPRKALLLSTIAQFVGPFLFGVAAATVLGGEVITPTAITPTVLYVGLSATIFWMIFTFYLKIPSSSTHSLLGGLLGAALAASGPEAIRASGLLKVLASLLLSAPVGFVGGFLMVRLWYWLARNATPQINQRFNQGQWFASLGLGMALGSINAQNTMGIIALGLVLSGFVQHFEVPYWVIAVCAANLAIGNLIGGMRLIKSLGGRFFQIRPIHGFSAELASTIVIGIASIIGSNVSTTHVTGSSIVGAGAGERFSMVRWGFVQNLFLTWILTIPLTATLAGLTYLSLRTLGVR